jgi:hypothetical protein
MTVTGRLHDELVRERVEACAIPSRQELGARVIFGELGFEHPVWSLPAEDGRF